VRRGGRLADLCPPMTTNRGQESQARGGPALPVVRAKRVDCISKGGEAETAARCGLEVPVLEDAHSRTDDRARPGPGPKGERTGRGPSPSAKEKGRDPYVLSANKQTNRPGGRDTPCRGGIPGGRPERPRCVRKARRKKDPRLVAWDGTRGEAGRARACSFVRATSSRPVSPACLCHRPDTQARGRRPCALTLSAPRAAGLTSSTIQQLSASPTRNSGMTYFLRKAGLSGPT
jgi:hypothetical protein